MCTRKTLIASAVLLGLGLTGQAFAQQTNTENGTGDDILVNLAVDASNNSTNTDNSNNSDNSDNSDSSNNSDNSDHSDNSSHEGDNRNNRGSAKAEGYGSTAANNGSTATSTFSNSFNHSKAVAETKLIGSVSGVTVHDIGNVAKNWGDANGGDGG
mgnify:FL=1